jgi:hypothetical protein
LQTATTVTYFVNQSTLGALTVRRAAAVFGLIAATVAAAADMMFPVPAGAEKPAHVVLSRGVAEQDYFFIKAPYPQTPALAHYEKVFAKWVACKPWQHDWDGYGDAANGANRYVHHFTRHWVTTDNRQAVTLLFRYESPGTAFRNRPENDNQFVAVIRHRVPDARAFLSELKVECPKAPNSRLLPDALGLPLYAAAHRAAKPER